jgi:hypothetical protein
MPFMARSSGRASGPVRFVSTDHGADRIGARVYLAHPVNGGRSASNGRVPTEPPGWQPSRFLADRGEAERAFALAERLGSVNAAATELGTTWPSLRKAFTRHGLGMPTRNPEAVRQRAIAAARQRSGQPATPSLDPVFVALNRGQLPVRARADGELAERVRRAEDYAVVGARGGGGGGTAHRKPCDQVQHAGVGDHPPRQRAHRLAGQRTSRTDRRHLDREERGERRHADCITRIDRTSRPHQPQKRGRLPMPL